jgi:hypothetical protein
VSGRATPPLNAGLCRDCLHRRLVETARGSRFVLCERSRIDPRFPRYPALPVVGCAGFEPSQEVRISG